MNKINAFRHPPVLSAASIAIVDEDRSPLSGRIRDAFIRPYFNEPELIAFRDIDAGMDSGRYTFVVVIPAEFEADILAGRRPTLQVNVDATAMMQAGIGDGYINALLAQEITEFAGPGGGAAYPVDLKTRYAFNPNLTSSCFPGATRRSKASPRCCRRSCRPCRRRIS